MDYLDRPISELSDDILVIAAGAAGSLRDRAVARGDHVDAAGYQAWALVLAVERDARAKLRRATEDAVSPFQIVGKVEFLDTDEPSG